MKIINKTKNTVLAEKVEVAKGFWKKIIGLMFRQDIGDDYCLLMEFGKEGFYSIWMFGMRFPIDVVFLDSRKRVVDIFENLKPIGMNPKTWRVYRPSKPIEYVLELRAGAVKKKKISLGDFFSFL